jgi:predicted aspartyl protease
MGTEMREFHFSPSLDTPLVRAILSGPKGAFRLRLVFDTGAHTTQLSKAAVSTLGFREENKTRAAYAVGVGGAREKGFEVTLPRLFVLGKKFQDVPACAFDMKYVEENGADGLLGWDIIRQLHIEMQGPAGILKVF